MHCASMTQVAVLLLLGVKLLERIDEVGEGREVLLELVSRNQLECFCSEGSWICEICFGYLWMGIRKIQKRLLPAVVERSRPQCNP